jgi:hypothetical protein
MAKACILGKLPQNARFFVVILMTNDDTVYNWQSSQNVFRLEDAWQFHESGYEQRTTRKKTRKPLFDG